VAGVLWSAVKVLVVDDHAETRQLLARTLLGEGHRVLTAADCDGAAAAVGGDDFDVIILDVMLPDGSGVDLARRLREQEIATPILLLTARGEVRDRVAGLDAGADDYLPKPFAVAELRARLRALVRRGPALRADSVRTGGMTVDLVRRRVTVHSGRDARPAPLTARSGPRPQALVWACPSLAPWPALTVGTSAWRRHRPPAPASICDSRASCRSGFPGSIYGCCFARRYSSRQGLKGFP
jgi:DNA-binding response OmpR family regulator